MLTAHWFKYYVLEMRKTRTEVLIVSLLIDSAAINRASMRSFGVAYRCRLLLIRDHRISYIISGQVWEESDLVALPFPSWNFMMILYASYRYLSTLLYSQIPCGLRSDFIHPSLGENAWNVDLNQLLILGYHVQILSGSKTNKITSTN